MKVGQLVQLADRRCFKLGIVIGASRAPGKIRVCVWSQNSLCWSKPQTVCEDNAHELARAELTSRQHGVVRRAIDHVARAHGTVAGVNVGRAFAVWRSGGGA